MQVSWIYRLHISFPEAHCPVDPPFRHSAFSQAESMPQALEDFYLRICPVILDPADISLHGTVGGNPIAGSHAGIYLGCLDRNMA